MESILRPKSAANASEVGGEEPSVCDEGLLDCGEEDWCAAGIGGDASLGEAGGEFVLNKDDTEKGCGAEDTTVVDSLGLESGSDLGASGGEGEEEGIWGAPLECVGEDMDWLEDVGGGGVLLGGGDTPGRFNKWLVAALWPKACPRRSAE